MPPSFTLVVRNGTTIYRREFVEEKYRNRTNTVRNPYKTLANRGDAAFSTVHPGFTV